MNFAVKEEDGCFAFLESGKLTYMSQLGSYSGLQWAELSRRTTMDPVEPTLSSKARKIQDDDIELVISGEASTTTGTLVTIIHRSATFGGLFLYNTYSRPLR